MSLSLRNLRLWHWDRVCGYRAGAANVDNSPKQRESFARRAEFHLSAVVALNSYVTGPVRSDANDRP